MRHICVSLYHHPVDEQREDRDGAGDVEWGSDEHKRDWKGGGTRCCGVDVHGGGEQGVGDLAVVGAGAFCGGGGGAGLVDCGDGWTKGFV